MDKPSIGEYVIMIPVNIALLALTVVTAPVWIPLVIALAGIKYLTES